MTRERRTFTNEKAVRSRVPLLVGLYGASGSGKTLSALRLARGMREVVGGQIAFIDTESGRSKHYADEFDFEYVRFDPPFSPLDYLDALEHCRSIGASIVVVDSASHEHEGPGGVLEWHETELDRLAGKNANYRERQKHTFSAWAAPKAARRRLINTILQLGVNAIFCFRAKEKLKIRTGQDPLDLGWMPISGDEWPYEMTLNALLYPGSRGVPTWHPNQPGERQMMKLPRQFEALFEKPRPLDESIGRALAEWARGGKVPAAPQREAEAAPASPPRDEAPPAPATRRDDEAEPCFAPVAGRRCKLSAGHAGNHVPEPPSADTAQRSLA